MCFSPLASFTSAGLLSAVGGHSIKKAKGKGELVFASVPLLFGVQQFSEGIVWITQGYPVVQEIFSHIFLFFALSVWPVYFPLAVLMMEKNKFRRQILKGFLGVGAILSVILILRNIFIYDIGTEICSLGVKYTFNEVKEFFKLSEGLSIMIYVFITMGSGLFSSIRYINAFALLGTLSALFSLTYYNATFTSTWCFFSAILSLMIYGYFVKKKS